MFIFKSYILSHKFYFCQERCISTIVSSMSVNSNQNTGTAGVVNNPNIAFCNLWNKWYSQSFRNCSLSTSSFFNAVFICAVYLFTLLECLKSSSLSSLRVKFRTIHTCFNLIVYISILLLYVNHFWFYEI